MKCEICHQNDAETAVTVTRNGVEEELYVCRACEKQERQQKQKRTQRTHQIDGLPPGLSVSVSQIGGNSNEPPPPFIQAIMHAMSDAVSNFNGKMGNGKSIADEKPYHLFPCERAAEPFRLGNRLHLEGLHLIGELPAVQRAFHAMDLKLMDYKVDGITNIGHTYAVAYSDSLKRAKRAVSDLLAQEENARIRLVKDMSRVFADSIARALGILKNCHLLSNSELYDLLSPLRLAAQQGFLKGISLKRIETFMSQIDFSEPKEEMSIEEEDLLDAERADSVNRIFKNVVLTDRAEGKLL